MAREISPEQEFFAALNASEKARGKKMPWPERYRIIREHFPSADRLNWSEAFRDVDLFGRVIRDILRVDQAAERKTSGSRPPFDVDRARERLRQLMGADYTADPFEAAFGQLAGDRSLMQLARKIGTSKWTVHMLKTGQKEPDLFMLEQIADAFGKDPAYFVEYRIAYVLGALGAEMSSSPETTVDLYRRLRGSAHAGQRY